MLYARRSPFCCVAASVPVIGHDLALLRHLTNTFCLAIMNVFVKEVISISLCIIQGRPTPSFLHHTIMCEFTKRRFGEERRVIDVGCPKLPELFLVNVC